MLGNLAPNCASLDVHTLGIDFFEGCSTCLKGMNIPWQQVDIEAWIGHFDYALAGCYLLPRAESRSLNSQNTLDTVLGHTTLQLCNAYEETGFA